jgi:hypothetical protein
MKLAGSPHPESGCLWEEKCIRGGLVSGEGLVWGVRDDDDIHEKRLLAFEPEFAQMLSIMDRHGNILSAQLRQAWDKGDLELLGKNSPARTTGAHISVVAHSTVEDVRRHLQVIEMANGFANRFLWCCVHRTKFLPDGGNLSPEILATLASRLQKAIKFAARVNTMQRDEAARERWHEMYPELAEGTTGLFGALTSRAEAQVLRLSMIYALLDCSATISTEHLLAAYALWKYCEASARYIFGDRTGDKISDRIMEQLERQKSVTRTEIRDLMGRHASEMQINQALRSLAKNGLAHSTSESTGGRPVERWFAVRRKRH